MPFLPLPVLVALAVLSSALLAFTAAWAILRHGSERLLDRPGPRSSHERPTPRGGGVGIVTAGLITIAALAWAGIWPVSWRHALPAFTLVALVGVIDDFRPQPVLLRLLAHFCAALLLVAASLPLLSDFGSSWLPATIAMAALVWSINLHNFMDGIDGLLVMQTIWCGCAFAALYWLAGEPGPTLFALLLAAACAGFLPLNAPRARIFLGDGASGFIGLAVGWLATYGAMRGAIPWPMSIAISSAFLVDSTATLLARALNGKRVWQGHREHLYQKLVQRGYRHSRVTVAYLLWNLLAVLPVLLAMRLLDSLSLQWMLALGLCIAGGMLWLILRRHDPAPAAIMGEA